MKQILPKFSLVLIVFSLFISCRKNDFPGDPAKKYSNEVAVAWINLQQRLIKATPGFGPGPAGRTFAYSGLSMYESIVPCMPAYQSLALQLAPVSSMPSFEKHKIYYWPASVNASMKKILEGFFTGAPIDGKISINNQLLIDSLYNAFEVKFSTKASSQELDRSNNFGSSVASAIFEWSKTDGTFAVNPPYVAPAGPGLWVPTPPAFAPPANPYGGTIRSFVPNLLGKVNVPPPVPYSPTPGSAFYDMVYQVYQISLSLTPDEINIAKTWGDIPGNYNGPSHFTNILTQLVVKENLSLDETALLYAKHGITIQDATIVVFKAKYKYNVIRPVSYIRGIIKVENWNTVIPTPPHPEYLSAHAVISQSAAEVLKEKFGNNYSFSDNTHANLYGTRTYPSFDAYAYEGAWSRVLGGLHYKPTADVSVEIGKKVGKLINQLRFKK